MTMEHDLILVAVINLFTAFVTWRTYSLTRQVVIHTNSMKDALVASTDKAARAEGKAEGKAEAEAQA